jgi:hypothetical protein
VYFVAKFEMQTHYIKNHMKMTKLKCIRIGIHMPRNFVLQCTCTPNLSFSYEFFYIEFVSQLLQQSKPIDTQQICMVLIFLKLRGMNFRVVFTFLPRRWFHQIFSLKLILASKLHSNISIDSIVLVRFLQNSKF